MVGIVVISFTLSTGSCPVISVGIIYPLRSDEGSHNGRVDNNGQLCEVGVYVRYDWSLNPGSSSRLRKAVLNHPGHQACVYPLGSGETGTKRSNQGTKVKSRAHRTLAPSDING